MRFLCSQIKLYLLHVCICNGTKEILFHLFSVKLYLLQSENGLCMLDKTNGFLQLHVYIFYYYTVIYIGFACNEIPVFDIRLLKLSPCQILFNSQTFI